MVQIPIYQPRVGLPGAPRQQRASGAEFGAGVGMALVDAGSAGQQTVQAVQHKLVEQEREDAVAWLAERQAQDRLRWTEELLRRQETAPSGAENFTGALLDDFDRQVAAVKPPNEIAGRLYQQEATQLRQTLGSSAMRFEAEERWRHRRTQLESALQTNAQTVTMAPGEFETVRASYLADVGETNLPPEAKSELAQLADRTLAAAAIQGEIERNPDEVASRLTGRPNAAYYDRLRAAESGGRNVPNAAGTSSAFGPFQFTEGTWRDLIAKHPDLGLKPADRFSPDAQERAIAAFTRDNAAALKAAGHAPTDGNLYLAHFLGAAGAVKFLDGLRSDPNAAASGYAAPDAVSANPAVFRKADGRPRSAEEVYRLLTARFGDSRTAEQAGFQFGGLSGPYAALTPEQLAAFTNRAEAAIRDRRIGLQAEIKGRVENSLAEAGATGVARQPVGLDEFVGAFGPNDGVARYETYQAEIKAARDRRAIGLLPPSDATALIESYRPKPGSERFAEQQRRFDELASAYSGQRKLLMADPAAYLQTYSSEISKAYGEVQAAASAGPEALKSASLGYARKIVAEQERLGVSPDGIRIVPQAYGEQIASQLSAPEQAGGSQIVAQRIRGLAEQWGEYWPGVYRDVKGAAGPVFEVIGSGVREPAAMALAEMATVSTDDVLKATPDTKKADIQTAVETAFAPFAQTLLATTGAVSTGRNFQDQGLKLAAYYHARGQSVDEAAKRAFDDLIGHKYEFADTYRIPKSLPYTPDLLDRNAEMILTRGLTANDIAAPVDDIGGLDEKTMREDALRSYRQFGAWVTAPGDTGLVLTYGNAAVLRPDGQPLVFTWDEIARWTPPLAPIGAAARQVRP
ncbi:hypothetical protein [Rhodoligotrophos defluvii]|uniref:hypothetical protein n=1 Tax=Rhodoligotrophos defluvii TaxID=2561934 RepID=UPI0010C939D3|nr:hypothetical protein [Rhodoligotrophos defluvii]